MDRETFGLRLWRRVAPLAAGFPLRGPAELDPSLSLLEVALLAFSLGAPLALLAGHALDLSGRAITLERVAGPVALALLAGVAVGWRCRVPLRVDLAGLAGGAVVAAAVLGHSLWLAWPTLYPVANSTDAVQHYQIAAYIVERHRLSHIAGPASQYLGILAVYPFGGGLLLALLAWALDASPLTLLHPFAALLLTLTSLFAYLTALALARQALGQRGLAVPVAVLGAAFVFVPRALSFGQFADSFFLAQMLGSLWLMALAYWLTRLHLTRRLLYVGPVVAGALALTVSYPLWLGPYGLTVAVALLVPALGSPARRLALAAAVFVPVALLLVVFAQEPGRLAVGQLVVTHEGEMPQPGLHHFGWPLMALAGLGLLLGGWAWRRCLPLVALALSLLLQLGAAYGLARLGVLATYTAQKTWAPLPYPIAALAAVSVAVLARHLAGRAPGRARASLLGAAALALALALSWSTWSDTQRRPPPFSPDLFAVSLWARDNLAGQRLALVATSPFATYWLEQGVLRAAWARPRFTVVRPAPSYAEWYLDASQPDLAVVEGVGDEWLLGATVLYRSGEAKVVRRDLGGTGAAAGAAGAVGEDRLTFPVRLGDDLLALGFELADRRFRAGETVGLRLRLVTTRDVERHYLAAAHLRDAAGRTLSLAEWKIAPAAGSRLLRRSEVLEPDLSLRLPTDVPPGAYQIEAFLLTLPEYQRVPSRGVGARGEQRLLVGPILVLRGDELLGAEERPSLPLGVRLGEGIALRGLDPAASRVSAGETLRLALYWETLGELREDYTVFVHLLGPDGRLVAQHDGQPQGGRFPTSFWRPGERLRDEVDLRVPAELAAGRYRLVGGLYLLRTLERLAVRDGEGRRLGEGVDLGWTEVVPGR